MNRQIRGKLYLAPSDGDMWTFLNELVRHIEAHDSYFKMVWTNAFVQPYREDFDKFVINPFIAPTVSIDTDNLLVLKVRGVGHADDARLATDALVSIIVSVAYTSNIAVSGNVEFTEWSVDLEE